LRGGEWVNVDIARPAMLCRTYGGIAVELGNPPLFQLADLSLPWPWPDSIVEEIYAADIFEHIGDWPLSVSEILRVYDTITTPPYRHWSGRIHVMNEAHRVLKPGGILTMECPDAAKGAGQWQDSTHVSPWTPNALQYYTDGSPAHRRFAEVYGITARFKVLSVAERRYDEYAGPIGIGQCPGGHVRCEVYKFTAILEAVKNGV
jgi:hypothetical protein